MTTATKDQPKTNGRFGLSSITQGGVQLPPRTLLYGTDGIGKTTFWSEAEDAIFVPTEDGATRLDVPQFPLCTAWDDETYNQPSVLGALRTLFAGDHKYKTVVLDSADWAQPLAAAHVVATEFNNDQAQYDAYGRGYKSLMRTWTVLLSALDHLRKHRGMAVALIAHAVVRPFHNPIGDDYDRYESNLISTQNTSLWAKTKEWCDIVLFANYAVTVKDADGPAGQAKKGKGVMHKGDGSRMCYASPAAAWDAKVRAGWSLPEKFPLDYATFQKHIREGA